MSKQTKDTVVLVKNIFVGGVRIRMKSGLLRLVGTVDKGGDALVGAVDFPELDEFSKFGLDMMDSANRFVDNLVRVWKFGSFYPAFQKHPSFVVMCDTIKELFEEVADVA
jgi:hypothetical protein